MTSVRGSRESAATPAMFGTVAQGILSPTALIAERQAVQRPLSWPSYVPRYDALPIEAAAPPPVPAPPHVAAVSNSSIRAQWDPVKAMPPVTEYAVVYSLDGGPESYVEEAAGGNGVVPAFQTSILIRSLDHCGELTVRVAARNAAGWSEYSMKSAVVTMEPPPPPTISKVEILDAHCVRIAWTPRAFPSGYVSANCYGLVLLPATGGGGVEMFADARTGFLQEDRTLAESFPAEQTTAIVRGLEAEVPYRAKVAAKNLHGWSSYSSLSEPVTILPPPAPDPPLLEMVGDRAMRVSWSAVTCRPAVTHYGLALLEDDVEKYVNLKTGQLQSDQSGLECVPAHTTSLLLLDLTPGAAYRARIAARSAVGWSLHSHTSHTCRLQWHKHTPPTPEPPHLEVLDINSLRISWDPMLCTPAVSHFAVVVCEGGVDRYINRVTRTLQMERAGAEVLQAGERSIVVQGISPDVAYSAKVVAKNEIGWGHYSDLGSAVFVVVPPQPAAPTVERLSNSSMRVSWAPLKASPPVTRVGVVINESGHERFIDARTCSLKPEREGSQSFEASRSSTVVTGLSLTAIYQAKVAAKNDVGWSEYSDYSDELQLNEEKRPATG